GGKGFGRSAFKLYQAFGICVSSKTNLTWSLTRLSLGLSPTQSNLRQHRLPVYESTPYVSIVGSRPTRRASWRSRLNSRSLPSGAYLPGNVSTNLPRFTFIGVFGSTPLCPAVRM